jgi:Lrp/AsnC family transcriptional regulator for asnA, asnC and gidA
MVRFSNLELLKELQKNSKISYVNLAKIFNVTETAIRKRVKHLENKGVIKGYNIDLDIKQLGYNINAIIGIDTLPEQYINIIQSIKADSDILKAYSTSGDHMILIEKYFKNYVELEEYITKLNTIKGITKVCPAIILEKIK